MNGHYKLLSRDAFREGVFARAGGRCVICGATGVDAHHILERRLWPDGGYYLGNGASVCPEHHLACERTTISVEDLRLAAGIDRAIIPPHLYDDMTYDKWGNPCLPNGRRLKGELFFDESVQKVLAEGGVLDLFSDQVKYPRTHHLPWSESVNDDDRVISSLSRFEGRRVIVTQKMDGENTTMYADYIHARSIDSRNHPSRAWVKNLHGVIGWQIPKGYRLCGENLYAEHSIAYRELPTYFMGFSMWTERNVCLGWDDTLEWFELLGVHPVPVVFDGIFDEAAIRKICKSFDWESTEGVVVRLADAISYGDFRHCVAKFVRRNHVQTVKHWMHGQAVKPNRLATALTAGDRV